MSSDRDLRTWPVLIAVSLAATLLYALAFFPGVIGFDSAYQWWQARSGETSNIHGIGMTWLWYAADFLSESPAPLFVLQLALFWCGLVLIAGSLPVRPIWRIAFLLLAGFAPIPCVVLSSVVSDALMMALLCCALGVCIVALGRGTRVPFLLVLVLLCLAVLVRKNAWPAVLPLAVFACWCEFPALRSKPARSVFCGLCVVGAMQGAGVLLQRHVERPVGVFAATAIWDLAAISIASGEMLLPASIHGPGLDVADLHQAFAPYSNVTIFTQTRAGMQPPFFAPGDSRSDEVRSAWMTAIAQHPRAYLVHRWRVALGLFGSKQPDWPRELVYFPGSTQYRDNPAVAVNANALHTFFLKLFDSGRSSLALAAWPYLLLAFAAAVLAWRHRAGAHGQAALAVIASGLLYALPLPLIAPSVELRYLAWTCAAAVLGAMLALAARVDKIAIRH